MKHVYYGKKERRILFFKDVKLKTMQRAIANNYDIKDLYYLHIEKSLEHLKRGLVDRNLAVNTFTTVDKEVIIAEKMHEHVLSIGDKVKIGDDKGVVEDRKYDALNDTMYYFTDIVAEVDHNVENNKQKMKEIQEEYIPVLESILEIHNPNKNTKENTKEEKGFWAKLFNLQKGE